RWLSSSRCLSRAGRRSPGRLVAGFERAALLAPLGLGIGLLHRDIAQRPNDRAIGQTCGPRNQRTRRRVHERHELVREAGHGAPDADTTHIRATTHTIDPAPLGHVALHYRTP